MKQMNLEIELEASDWPSDPPPVALEPSIQAELVARLAELIITVHQKQQEPPHARTSQSS